MTPKWLLVLPPEGAARQVGFDLHAALLESPEGALSKIFDTKAYLEGFLRLLREPDDDMRVDLMNQALVVSALDHRTTHILVLALAPLTAFTVRLLQQQGVQTVHWFIEDYRQALYWSQVLPAYRFFFAIQREPLVTACETLGVTFGFLPTAAAPKLLHRKTPPWQERPLDFAFVGLPSPYRITVLEALASAGARMQIGGTGWQHYRGPLQNQIWGRDSLSPAESWDLLEKARFGLHLPYEDAEVDRDHSHVSPRIYDLMALGCYPLLEDGPLLREGMQGCHVEWFKGPQQAIALWQNLKEAVTTAMGSEAIQNQLKANTAQVKTRHSYQERWRTLQKLCGI